MGTEENEDLMKQVSDVDWLEGISQNEWETTTIDEIKDKFCGWIDEEVKSSGVMERQEVENKLIFRFRDVFVEEPNGDTDLYFSVERVEEIPEEQEEEGDTV